MYDCKLKRTIDKIMDVTIKISACAILVMASIMLINIVTRRFFRAPIPGCTDIIGFFAFFIACTALAYKEWTDWNIIMSLLVDKLSPRNQKKAKCIVALISGIGFCALTTFIGGDAIVQYQNGKLTTALHVPWWMIETYMTISFGALAVVTIIKLFLYLKALSEEKKAAETKGGPA